MQAPSLTTTILGACIGVQAAPLAPQAAIPTAGVVILHALLPPRNRGGASPGSPGGNLELRNMGPGVLEDAWHSNSDVLFGESASYASAASEVTDHASVTFGARSSQLHDKAGRRIGEIT